MKQILKTIKNSSATQVLILAVVLLTSYKLLKRPIKNPTTAPAFAETTAMITNLEGNSGGSGVVLESNADESLVLTNSHVCEVTRNGGIVRTDTKSAIVVSFQQSEIHDLCLIKVKADLGINTKIADNAPQLFSKASIAGHPQLLPTIVTEGHFSHKVIIPVLFKIKKCEDKDYDNPDLGMFCLFFGGIPIIRIFEAQPVSATIQPGSSGSAVFNSEGNISGLVFAGSGQLAYAYIVPLEYVKFFVEKESKTLTEVVPSSEINLSDLLMKKKIRTTCKENVVPDQIKNICNIIEKDSSIY